MSHFSRIKTVLRDRALLTMSLEELGYEVIEGGTVKGRQGLREVDLSIRTKDGNGIGFTMDHDGSYTLIADWYGIGRRDQKILSRLNDTLAKVQRNYAERIALQKAEQQGFSVVERTEEPDGSIRIVVRRWT
jgi:hypothetical protein